MSNLIKLPQQFKFRMCTCRRSVRSNSWVCELCIASAKECYDQFKARPMASLNEKQKADLMEAHAILVANGVVLR